MTSAAWLLAVIAAAYWSLVAAAMIRVSHALVRVADAEAGEGAAASLSIVVAARDEREAFAHEAEALERLDYPQLEVVLVDDRSSDGTGELMDAIAAADARVRVVHVPELPEGWLGKVHALEQGRAVASGEWLLLTDADVELAADAPRRAVALAEARELDALALLPQVRADSALVAGVVATFSRWLVLGTRLWHAADAQRPEAFGVGAFNLVRARALQDVGGLEWLRMDVADDAALAQLIAGRGGRTMLASGVGLVEVQWQDSVRGMTRGFEKYGGTGGAGSIPAAIVLVSVALLGELAPWLAMLAGVAGGAWAPAIVGLAIVLGAGAVQLALGPGLGAPRRALAAGPLAPMLVWWMQVRAAWLEHRRGGVIWRDTFYATEQLRAGKRYRLPGAPGGKRASRRNAP